LRALVITIASIISVAGVAVAFIWLTPFSVNVAGTFQGDINRGKNIAVAGDCVACHPAPGGKLFAGSLSIVTSFGKIVTSNITPDPETGIGGIDVELFNRVTREGIGIKGQRLYPAMPYNHYAGVTDQDLADLKAYLDTIPPVKNKVEANQLPFPFNVRQLIIGWNLLFFHAEVFRPDLAKTPQWNRGSYLVDGLGHCASCHTSKNFWGGDNLATLHGGEVNGWNTPSLVKAPRVGLGRWTIEDIVSYLATGGSQHAVAAGPMDEVVSNSMSKADVDISAVAVYLKSLPGENPEYVPLPITQGLMAEGRKVYESNCAACHTVRGKGLKGVIPPFAGNVVVQSNESLTVLQAVLIGIKPVHWDPASARVNMPGFAGHLNDAQVAALATYIRVWSLNYRGGGGLAWFAPVAQARGSDAINQLNLIRPVLDQFGFEYVGGSPNDIWSTSSMYSSTVLILKNWPERMPVLIS